MADASLHYGMFSSVRAYDTSGSVIFIQYHLIIAIIRLAHRCVAEDHFMDLFSLTFANHFYYVYLF